VLKKGKKGTFTNMKTVDLWGEKMKQVTWQEEERAELREEGAPSARGGVKGGRSGPGLSEGGKKGWHVGKDVGGVAVLRCVPGWGEFVLGGGVVEGRPNRGPRGG